MSPPTPGGDILFFCFIVVVCIVVVCGIPCECLEDLEGQGQRPLKFLNFCLKFFNIEPFEI